MAFCGFLSAAPGPEAVKLSFPLDVLYSPVS